MNSSQRVQLPPISSIAPGMPTLHLTLPQSTEECAPNTAPDSDTEYIKPIAFTPLEDISILRTIRLFYGRQFTGTIPWSFWQIYKRATGSERSTSSLYHHWKGAMRKKFEVFLRDGRIDDCIRWAESALEIENASTSYMPKERNQKKNVLIHTKSHQEIPPEFEFGFRLQNQNSAQFHVSSPQTKLAHVSSLKHQTPNQLSGGPITKFPRNQSTPLSKSPRKLQHFPSTRDVKYFPGQFE